MTGKSFSVRIFLQDGHANGVRIVSRSKWSGRGIVIPRGCLAEELGRAELSAPGVYLLTETGVGAARPTLCIGAADPVCDGLARHATDDQSWSMAVVFSCKENNLNLRQCQSLAARLLQLARSADKAEIISADCFEQPRLSPAESAAVEIFLDHMLGLYPLFGVNVFEK
jgi:hypothetical protein